MANIPYIGSKISLITTSDIRYEGILYTLNREESTIAVQNVRSFGTEGRRIPEVPMSNEIYDFIIFRGKDLKDLTVLQGAPEPQAATPYGAATSAVGSSEFLGSHGSSLYNHSVAPADHCGGLQQSAHPAMAAYQRPSVSSGPQARNGYLSQAASTLPTTMPSSYAAGPYPGNPVVPAAAVVRPAERAAASFSQGSGVQVRQAYAPQPELQASALSPHQVRAPLYEESNGAAAARGAAAAAAAAAAEEQAKASAVPRSSAGASSAAAPVETKDRGAAAEAKDPKARGRGKGGGQKKPLYEVLKFHKRAEETIVKQMRGQASANLGPSELRAMSETNSSVYHFYLDFVNYCCPSHTVQSDEQQWEMLCKALKKHFEKEFGANQSQKAPPPQRPNNTLGDFITIETKTAKKGPKVARGGGRVGRGAGRGGEKAGAPSSSQGSGEVDGPGGLDESPAQSTSWACPRCTLRNENLLLECAACGTSKQQAALWAEFPPLG